MVFIKIIPADNQFKNASLWYEIEECRKIKHEENSDAYDDEFGLVYLPSHGDGLPRIRHGLDDLLLLVRLQKRVILLGIHEI